MVGHLWAGAKVSFQTYGEFPSSILTGWFETWSLIWLPWLFSNKQSGSLLCFHSCISPFGLPTKLLTSVSSSLLRMLVLLEKLVYNFFFGHVTADGKQTLFALFEHQSLISWNSTRNNTCTHVHVRIYECTCMFVNTKMCIYAQNCVCVYFRNEQYIWSLLFLSSVFPLLSGTVFVQAFLWCAALHGLGFIWSLLP